MSMLRRRMLLSEGAGGYEFVEYIEIPASYYGTVNAPHIDTGVIPTLPFTMIADTMFTGTSSGPNANYNYGRAGASSPRVGLRVLRNGGPYIIPSVGGSEIYNWVISNDRIANIRVSVKFELMTNSVAVYLNDALFKSQSVTGRSPESSFFLLCEPMSNGSARFPFIGRAYGYKLYNNGILVRDFVPAVRKSDGAVGMVDLLGNPSPFDGTPFYGNSGTGSFLYG